MLECRDWNSDEGTKHGVFRGTTLVLTRRGATINLKPVADGVEICSVLPDGTIARTVLRCAAGKCAA